MAGGAPLKDPADPQDLWRGVSVGVSISAYLLSALVAWGAIGYLVDRLVGTRKVFTAIGMVVGAAAGVYLIYLRYGKEHDDRRGA